MKSIANQTNQTQAPALASKINSNDFLNQEKRLQRKQMSRVAPTNLNYHLADMDVQNDTGTRVQAKLFVGAPNDRFEQEADRVADTIMRMPTSSVQAPTLQRKKLDNDNEEDKKHIQRKPLFTITPLPIGSMQRKLKKKEDESEKNRIQRKMNDKEDKKKDEENKNRIQRKPTSNTAMLLDDDIDSQIKSLRGTGQPLPDTERQFFEPRFRRDLNNVRVHTSGQAARAAQSINARAFTLGNDIVFNQGQFQPGTDNGRHLIAHELTHVVQQNGGSEQNNVNAASQISAQRQPIVQRSILSSIVPDFALDKINNFAEEYIPFFDLIKVIIGENPITGKKVPRTGINIIRALLPNKIERELEQSQKLQAAGEWLDKEISTLNITWQRVKKLLTLAWNTVKPKSSSLFGKIADIGVGLVKDVFTDDGLVGKFSKALLIVFSPMVKRIKNFKDNIVDKTKSFILNAVLSKFGTIGAKILAVLTKGKKILTAIFDNPIGFVQNVLNAIANGFALFRDNFSIHFKTILFNWLFGALSAAGIQLPETFTLKSIFALTAEILGITKANIRFRLVKRLNKEGIDGEKSVSRLEKGADFIGGLIQKGPQALQSAPEQLWQQLMTKVDSLKQIVIDKALEWVRNTIIIQAVKKLVSMANPVGGVVTLVKALYDVFSFVIERARQLADFVSGIFNTLAKIAAGKDAGIAKFVEGLLVKASTLMVSFLARLIGLGGISKKIKKVINSLRKPVNKVIDKVVGWAVNGAKGLFKGAKGAAKNIKQKFLKFWKIKRSVIINKEKHTLSFLGEGKNAKLVLNSQTMLIAEWIEKEKKFFNKIPDSDKTKKDRILKASNNKFDAIKTKAEEIGNNIKLSDDQKIGVRGGASAITNKPGRRSQAIEKAMAELDTLITSMKPLYQKASKLIPEKDQLPERLIKAINGNFRQFLTKIRNGKVGDYTKKNFEHDIELPGVRTLLGVKYRKGKLHEWLPTNTLGDIAIAEPNLANMLGDMQDRLQTDTKDVIFNDNHREPDAEIQTGNLLQGHIGAIYAVRPDKKRKPMTKGQATFHDRLRSVYLSSGKVKKDITKTRLIDGIKVVIKNWLLGGTTLRDSEKNLYYPSQSGTEPALTTEIINARQQKSVKDFEGKLENT